GLLAPGDLVVLNTSATLPAAVPALRADGTELELRLSTPAPHGGDELWVVELRRGESPFGGLDDGEQLALPAGGRAAILAARAGAHGRVVAGAARASVPGALSRPARDRAARRRRAQLGWPRDRRRHDRRPRARDGRAGRRHGRGGGRLDEPRRHARPRPPDG